MVNRSPCMSTDSNTGPDSHFPSPIVKWAESCHLGPLLCRAPQHRQESLAKRMLLNCTNLHFLSIDLLLVLLFFPLTAFDLPQFVFLPLALFLLVHKPSMVGVHGPAAPRTLGVPHAAGSPRIDGWTMHRSAKPQLFSADDGAMVLVKSHGFGLTRQVKRRILVSAQLLLNDLERENLCDGVANED